MEDYIGLLLNIFFSEKLCERSCKVSYRQKVQAAFADPKLLYLLNEPGHIQNKNIS